MKRYILAFLVFFILTSADNSKPKVLIIGDSISLGYTPYVKELMKDEAIGENDVHFTTEGYQFLAEQVSDEIRKKLK
jgi:lysophospholipase L1-like esterase